GQRMPTAGWVRSSQSWAARYARMGSAAALHRKRIDTRRTPPGALLLFLGPASRKMDNRKGFPRDGLGGARHQKGAAMSTGTNQGWHVIGAEELKRGWGWFLALGIVLVLLGVVALSWAVLTTLVSAVLFGWLLLVGGVLSVVHAFLRRRWGGFFLELFPRIRDALGGLVMRGNPT